MSTVSAALEQRVWTFDDLQQLPDEVDWRRYEIVDGALVVSPGPAPTHEFASSRLLRIVAAQLPSDVEIIGPVTVDLAPSYRIPDLVVVPMSVFGSHEKRIWPRDVRLAVEVVSPGSQTTDRITKPAQYAAAGIPAYWRVETDPVSLTAYELDRGATVYTEVGSWTAGQVARLDRPCPLSVEIDRLWPTG
ncbi:MAG: Uma2 family endonuclease [Trebonia sp.]